VYGHGTKQDLYNSIPIQHGRTSPWFRERTTSAAKHDGNRSRLCSSKWARDYTERRPVQYSHNKQRPGIIPDAILRTFLFLAQQNDMSCKVGVSETVEGFWYFPFWHLCHHYKPVCQKWAGGARDAGKTSLSVFPTSWTSRAYGELQQSSFNSSLTNRAPFQLGTLNFTAGKISNLSWRSSSSILFYRLAGLCLVVAIHLSYSLLKCRVIKSSSFKTVISEFLVVVHVDGVRLYLRIAATKGPIFW
jgi:hypothetical protein